jgi:predicted PurR-regulated permease PerM
MENRIGPSTQMRADVVLDDDLHAAEQHARQRWARLASRVRSITPSGLARFLLVVGALAAIVALVWSARIALAPFVAGMVLAYITAPLVAWFDRILPRWLAVLLVVVGELLLIVGVVILFVPPLIDQLLNLIRGLPSIEDIRRMIGQLAAYVRGLPDPMRGFVLDGVRQSATTVRDNLLVYLQTLLTAGLSGALSLLNTFGFILSFLVIPTWLFAVLGDRNLNTRVLAPRLPAWLRGDLLAVLRICDRTFRAFVGGQLIIGLAVGLLTYAGARLLDRQGWLDINYPLLLALLTGLLALIPAVGTTLTAVLVVLLGLLHSQRAALLLLLLVIVVQQIVNRFVAPRVERSYASNVHPALLVIAIVIVSQFGLFWLLLAAPITSAIVDLYRYIYGRLSDPPRPAGLLPGEALRRPSAVASTPAVQRRIRPTRAPFAIAREPAPGITEERHG